MNTFILILTIILPGEGANLTTNSIEFNSIETCNTAALAYNDRVTNQSPSYQGSYKSQIIAKCFKK
jgi:hypothetical protein